MSQLGLAFDSSPPRRGPAPPPPVVATAPARTQAPEDIVGDPAAIAGEMCGDLREALDGIGDLERELAAPVGSPAPEYVERHVPVRLRRADAERLRARQVTLRVDIVRLPGCDVLGDGLDPLVPIALSRIEERAIANGAVELAMTCRRLRVAIESGDVIALDLRPYARPLLAALHVLALAGDADVPGVDRAGFLDGAHDDATAADLLLHQTRSRLDSPPTWDEVLVERMRESSARAEEDVEHLRSLHASILGCSVDELDAREAEEKRREQQDMAERRVERPGRGRSSASAPAKAQRSLEAEPAAPPTRRLDYRQRELLALVAVEGNRAVYTRDERIADWASLKLVIEALGGKWRSGGKRRRGGWDFPDDVDATEVIRLAQESGEILDLRAAGLFETPEWLAEELVRIAEVPPGAVVLEPSAGRGRIAMAVRRIHPDARVLCVELLEQNVRELEKLGFEVLRGDFLSIAPADLPAKVDVAVLNPPFAKFADAAHVRHALRFVRPGGRIAAIMSAGARYRDAAPYLEFRAAVEADSGRFEDCQEGSFLESGTGVRTVKVVMTRGAM